MAAVNVRLLVFAAGRPPRLIDISCPRGAQQQTHRTLLQRSIDGTDRHRTVTYTLLRILCKRCQKEQISQRYSRY